MLFPQFKFFKNIIQSLKKELPYKLLFAVTFSCNSRCIMCNNWQVNSRNELDISEIRKIFSRIPFHITWLAITGGEPFLREDLVDVIRSALKYFPTLAMVSIVSNGLEKDKIISDFKEIVKLQIPFLFLRLSIDGPESVHNEIRGISDAYKKTMETYYELKNIAKSYRQVNIGIEITLSSVNVEHVGQFFSGLLREHIVNISIAHKGYLYNNIENEDYLFQMDLKALKRVFNIQKKRLSDYKLSDLIQKIYIKKAESFFEDKKAGEDRCVALRSSFGIDPYGNIIPCLMWNRVLGNLRNAEYDFKKIWNNPERKNILREIAEKKCIICWTPCEAYQKILNDITKKLFWWMIK